MASIARGASEEKVGEPADNAKDLTNPGDKKCLYGDSKTQQKLKELVEWVIEYPNDPPRGFKKSSKCDKHDPMYKNYISNSNLDLLLRCTVHCTHTRSK